ncbi:hypothetical protein PV396_26685 [Streptomyces sp. ME02-8801-2C]|uniref:hypothetical protein n=1 Tax=Streptomyces sp. ME02-8801-2C TaxID=3028680 RepID=UPI0029A501CA|nr:hypothetical protein [Streptomyces sp. ME02-8801-2C]MDX3455480.1 hypothetical protein [Streptomyces sp. ME02-8801-2C]
MSAAAFTPASVAPVASARSGATPVRGGHRHPVGDALRAARVFAGAALSVVLLGEYREYGEEAGVRRR